MTLFIQLKDGKRVLFEQIDEISIHNGEVKYHDKKFQAIDIDCLYLAHQIKGIDPFSTNAFLDFIGDKKC